MADHIFIWSNEITKKKPLTWVVDLAYYLDVSRCPTAIKKWTQ
jgi:hypothetical protein